MKKYVVYLILALSCSFVLTSCSMPVTSVQTVDDRPTLAFKGAPQGALLFIDGLGMGAANQYNGRPNVLTVEPGTHNIRVTSNNATIYEQRVFVESSLKTITIK